MMRLSSYLLAGGLVGVVSLLLAPIERLAPVDLPIIAVRLIAVIQPALLVIVGVFVGCALAPKVRLGAPVIAEWAEGRALGEALRRQIPPALGVGVATAMVLLYYMVEVAPLLATALPIDDAGPFTVPLLTKLLYGGISEELIMRWGLMSLLTWTAWRLTGRPERLPAIGYWIAIVLAAALFALGHLPLLHALGGPPENWLLVTVLAGNALPGIAFGWLFWRFGIEAAMIAHASAHLISTVALSLLA